MTDDRSCQVWDTEGETIEWGPVGRGGGDAAGSRGVVQPRQLPPMPSEGRSPADSVPIDHTKRARWRRWVTGLGVGAVFGGAVTAFILHRSPPGPSWSWGIQHDGPVILEHRLGEHDLAIASSDSTPQVQVVDGRTGVVRREPMERSILARAPAGQPGVVLSLDAGGRVSEVSTVASDLTTRAVHTSCPNVSGYWFSASGSVVGIGYGEIIRIGPNGDCSHTPLGDVTLNLTSAGIDASGTVYVTSNNPNRLCTVRPESGGLKVHDGIEADAALAVSDMAGVIIASDQSIASYLENRELWRTSQVGGGGVRIMARSESTVGVGFADGGERGIAVLRTSDGKELRRIRQQVGGAFTVTRNCVVTQDLGRADWIGIHRLDTGDSFDFARPRLSMTDGMLGRVVHDIRIVGDAALVLSANQIDAHRVPAECF